MSAVASSGRTHSQERLLGDLTDAALRVAARHGVRGRSVDQELNFWRAMLDASRVARAAKSGARSACDRLAVLTDAAYRAALRQGIPGSFSAFELDLWDAFRAVESASRPARADRAYYACV